jgi:hypothetical protein
MRQIDAPQYKDYVLVLLLLSAGAVIDQLSGE